jgi:acyl-coenzyme A synthetase/AMP-(fatty) acid ligase
VALGPGGAGVNWGTFCGEVCALRSEILALAPSEWVLRFDDSFHFAVAFCAALAANKSVLLPGNTRPEAVAALADHRRGCLHDGEKPARFDVALPLPRPEGAQAAKTFDIADVDSPRITLLTSGSTGQPKPIRKSLSNLLTEVAALETTWGDQLDGVRVVSTVSHQHIYGLLFRVLWPLCAGRPFDRHSLLFPEQVLEQASKDAALVTSPAILKRIASGAPASYRAVFSSGGALSPEAAAESIRHLGCRPIEVFGSTETGGIAWRRQTGRDAPWSLFPGVRAEIGADQALRVRSPYVATSGWIATGDAACLLDDRRFVWLGRTDHIVKIAEKRVSLAEVEERLVQLEWVREAAVLPLGPADKMALGAALVLTPAGRAAREQLGLGRFRLQVRRELRRWLEPAAVPRRYREVPALPANAQGKLMREELLSIFGAAREARTASRFPTAQVEMAKCGSKRG